MEVRRSPDRSDPARALLEKSLSEGNSLRVDSIQLDSIIESLRDSTIHGELTIDDALFEVGADIQSVAPTISLEELHARRMCYTDLHRVTSTSLFAGERLLAPLLYSTDLSSLGRARYWLSDGIAAKSTQSLAAQFQLLDHAFALEAHTGESYLEIINGIRGAMQEDTVIALLNDDQSGVSLALPASTHDDISLGTDAYLYRYKTRDAVGYRHAISVKSTREQKEVQAQAEPHHIIITAEEIGNRNLSISRLLAQRDAGYPGITPEEEAILLAAKQKVLSIVEAKLGSNPEHYRRRDRLQTISSPAIAEQLTFAA